MKRLYQYIFILLIILPACKKDDQQNNTGSNNRIPQIVADNFNLAIFNTVISRGDLLKELYNPGPYTILAPSDNAFVKAGYGNPAAVIATSQPLIAQIAAYHVLNGKYELNRLPFLFNQEIRTYNGGKLYVTRWMKDGDTVLTVNGSRVLTTGIPASNGILQVINRMLEPYLHENLSDAISAETSLTLFSQALQRAGLSDMLKEAGPYTIYAPTNEAMQALGYTSIQVVNEEDPAVLAALLKYHIVADRRFVNDYILSTGSSAVSSQGMINNNTVKVTLVPDTQIPGAFGSITFQGTGNTGQVHLVRQDIITGNGVLHIIDQVLKITQ